jgi:hypothetical protein
MLIFKQLLAIIKTAIYGEDMRLAIRDALEMIDATAEKTANKGQPDGYASLDNDGKVPYSQMHPMSITDVEVFNSETDMLSWDAANIGDLVIRMDILKSFILRAEPASVLANWQELPTPTDAVQSVNGKTGVVALAPSDIGLANVENTSDADKPVSTATATALADKLSVTGGITILDPQKDSGTTERPIVNLLGYIADAVIKDRASGKAYTDGKINAIALPDGITISVNQDTQLLEISDGGVGYAKLAVNSVRANHIAPKNINSSKIGDGEIKNLNLGYKSITFDKMADVAVTADTNGKINENLLKIAPGTYPWYVTAPGVSPAGLIPELVRKYNGVITCLETLGHGETPDNFTPFLPWRRVDYFFSPGIGVTNTTPPDDGKAYTAIFTNCLNVSPDVENGLGDVDGDGYISILDYVSILNYDVGKITLTETQRIAADMNGDGEVDLFDAIILQRITLGTICPDAERFCLYGVWENEKWVLSPLADVDLKGTLYAYSRTGDGTDDHAGILVNDGVGNVIDLGWNVSELSEAAAERERVDAELQGDIEVLEERVTKLESVPASARVDYYIDASNISDITPPDDGRVYTAIVVNCAKLSDVDSIPNGKGDVDGDGYITPIDMWLLHRYFFNEITLTPSQFSRGDADGDGDVSSSDTTLILNEIAPWSSTPTRAIYAEWQNGTWVLLPYSSISYLFYRKGVIFAYSKNGLSESLKYPGLLVSDGAGNVVDLGGNFPGLLQAVAGKADKPFSSVVTVNTPAFPNQPIVFDGSPLDSAFVVWTSDYYFVTLKDTDGTALPAGQFKLTKKVGGTLASNSTDYANANAQVFYLANLNTGNGTLVDSSCVDFLQIGDNFQMRFGGSNIQINVPNKDRFKISFSGSFPQPRFDTSYPRYKLGLQNTADITYRGVIANANYNSMLLAPLAANGNRFLHLRFDAEIIKSGNSINCPTITRYFTANTRDMNNTVTATANTFLGWVSKNTVNYDFAGNAIKNIQMLGYNIGGTSEIILNGGTFRVDEIL